MEYMQEFRIMILKDCNVNASWNDSSIGTRRASSKEMGCDNRLHHIPPSCTKATRQTSNQGTTSDHHTFYKESLTTTAMDRTTRSHSRFLSFGGRFSAYCGPQNRTLTCSICCYWSRNSSYELAIYFAGLDPGFGCVWLACILTTLHGRHGPTIYTLRTPKLVSHGASREATGPLDMKPLCSYIWSNPRRILFVTISTH
jgi:hypothetical protein